MSLTPKCYVGQTPLKTFYRGALHVDVLDVGEAACLWVQPASHQTLRTLELYKSSRRMLADLDSWQPVCFIINKANNARGLPVGWLVEAKPNPRRKETQQSRMARRHAAVFFIKCNVFAFAPRNPVFFLLICKISH